MADKAARKNGNETGKSTPPVEHQFKAGNSGRPKGSRNKLGEAFIQAMHADFEDHGVAAIERVRKEKPDQYLKVIASMLPKDINLNVNQIGELTDEQLIERIRKLDAAIGPFLASQGEGGTDSGDRAKTAH